MKKYNLIKFLSATALILSLNACNKKEEVKDTEIKHEVTKTVETKKEEVVAAVQAKKEEVVAAVETKKEEVVAAVETKKEEIVAAVETKKEEIVAAVETKKEEVLAAIATKKNDIKVNLGACKSCHGANFEKHALGKSKIVANMTKDEVSNALVGYKEGTYGGSAKGIMKGQVVKYSVDALKNTGLGK